MTYAQLVESYTQKQGYGRYDDDDDDLAFSNLKIVLFVIWEDLLNFENTNCSTPRKFQFYEIEENACITAMANNEVVINMRTTQFTMFQF